MSNSQPSKPATGAAPTTSATPAATAPTQSPPAANTSAPRPLPSDAAYRRNVNTLFTLTSGLSRSLAPDLFGGDHHHEHHDDDHDGYSDDDNDTIDSDDDDMDDGEVVDDDNQHEHEPEEMQAGDEPLTSEDQHSLNPDSNNNTHSDEHGGASHGDASTVVKSMGLGSLANQAAANYKFVPEKVEAPTNAPPANGPPKAAAPGQQTPAAPNAGASTAPKASSAVTQPSVASAAPRAPTAAPAPQTPSTTTSVTTNPAASTITQGIAPSVAAASAQPAPTGSLPPNTTTPAAAAAAAATTQAQSPTPAAAPAPKVDPLGPTPAAPHGYKVVQVKKPDGTLAMMKRPITAQEAAAAAAQAAALAPTAAAPHGFELVKLKKPDGSLVTVKKPLTAERAAAIATQKSQPAGKPPMPPAGAAAVPRPQGAMNGSSVPPPTQANTINPDPKTAVPNAANTDLEKGIDSVDLNEKKEALITATEVPRSGSGSLEKEGAARNVPEKDPVRHIRRMGAVIQFISWTIMLLFPLVFIALAVAVLILNGHVVPGSQDITTFKNGSDVLSQLIKVAASAWPIVFAAVLAQSLKMYAAHRVEKGIQLMTLEQLTSSHSLASAIKQPFMLRTVNWTSLILFVVWGLSPLAGQAILRMSNTDVYGTNATASVTYYQYPNATNSFWSYSADSYAEVLPLQWLQPMLNNLVLAFTPDGSVKTDYWKNPLIPVPGINPLVGVTSHTDDANTRVSTLTSLIGVPIWINSTYDPQQSSDLYVNGTWFSLQCADPVTLSESDPLIQSLNLIVNPDITFHFTAENNTVPPLGNGSVLEPGPDGVIHFASRVLDDSAQENNLQVYYYNCSYTNYLITNHVYCDSYGLNATCTSYRSQYASDQSDYRPSLGAYFASTIRGIAAIQGYSTESDNNNNLCLMEEFIRAPTFALQPLKNDAGSGVTDSLANITGSEVSQRLGLIVNTLWQLGQNQQAYLGHDNDTWGLYDYVPVVSTPATFYWNAALQYTVSILWTAILIACSVVLVVAAVAGIIWERTVVGPDFLGFANTALKKNVKMPKQMSAMNARERLLHLQNAKVMLHDLKPNAPVGKIGLAIKDEDSVPLLRGREYR